MKHELEESQKIQESANHFNEAENLIMTLEYEK